MANHSAYFPRTTTESLESGAPPIRRLYIKAASLDRFGMGMLRLGLVTVLVWIGGLKFISYEADSILPLVANSPFMSFLYHYPAPEYREHMNKEGQAIPANQHWNESNGTYPVSYGLGVIIVSLGIMIALYPIWPQVSAVGSFLLISSERNADERRGAMSMILIFAGKWNRWYRVLRHSKGFGLFDSLRYGLWLARG
jgi:hypothetical protein